MKLPFLLLSFLLFSSFLQGQNIRQLSGNEGLPQSFVSGLVQDRDGFIWIGTLNGLARFDGHNFKIFQQDFSNPGSLSSNAITDLQMGPGNTLWLKFETGEIDLLDIDSEKITHVITQKRLQQEPISIIRRGWKIGAHDKVWHLSRRDLVNSFTYSKRSGIREKKTYAFSGDTIRSLLVDSRKKVWILRQKGLSVLVSDKDQFLHYPLSSKQYFNDHLDFGDDVPDVHERANGELMWTDRKHLFIFNTASRKYRTIKLPSTEHYSVKWINVGPDGKEYFVHGNSLYSFDDTVGIVNHTKGGINALTGIQAFLVDRSGMVWTGGNTNGITQIDLSTNFKSHAYKKDFATDVLTRELGFPANLLPASDARYLGVLPQSYYLRSLRDHQNTWIALNRMVYCHDARSKTVRQIPLPATANKKAVPIKGLAIGNDGKPLVVDDAGNLYVYDQEWKTVDLVEGKVWKKFTKAKPNGLLLDHDRIWITTEYDGLFYISRKKKTLQHVGKDKEGLLLPKCLYGIVADPRKKELFWIGSTQGLVCFNKNTLKSTLFSVKRNKLPDNVIYSLLPDKQGNLWLGTNKGLVCFDPVSHVHKTFTVSHGLPDNEFNRFHQMVLPGDKLAFGGIKGYVVFNPLEIQKDDFNPPTQITDIHVNNTDVRDGLLGTPPNATTRLDLDYDENTLRIGYAALQFNHPKDICYRYRLRGYDSKWVLVQDKRDAVYTKIPPGHYVFDVNATNTSGKWSSHIKSLPITIASPWWNSWWSWILYLLLFACSTIAFINFKIRQRLMKAAIVLKEKEALQLRALDGMKTRFFSNITHELRTPLTLILAPAGELKKNLSDAFQINLAELIEKNAVSLLNLTNQLLDLSKLEAGALSAHPDEGDLAHMIRAVVEAFSKEAQSKEVTIELYLPDTAKYWFDPELMESVLFNLLSNAIRFSPRKGCITIHLEIVDGGVRINLSDNGPGIAEEDLPYIFDRFYRADAMENKVGPGSGIGLSLVKEVIELQGGTIEVLSHPEDSPGAAFVVFLPLESGGATEATLLPNQITEDGILPDDDRLLVLVVEDHKELAAFITSVLDKHYDVITCPNGREALTNAIKFLPDLIISDVLMPEMDGFALCHALKTDRNTSHIPVILLTAKGDLESKLEGLSHGADDYMAKPFSTDELLARLKNRFSQQKRMREAMRRELTSLPGGGTREEASPVDPFLLLVYQTIEEHIDDNAFGVEELAAALHVSRTSLHRKIKSLTAMTTSEMLRAYRLARAIPLLKQNLTIAEVAYKTGFSSPNYFTRSFRELYGITPTEYLKNTLLEQ